ncbi:MAG TPA: cytochrome c biogenesis protein CcdA [Phototrophicaceae bacterium]|nr:cytochrome c biogenesis protein CcdA [Phototrophicaceae bacterium]
MSDYAQAFILGNQAILTNVCLLPLYPGLIAFLTGSAGSEHAPRAGGWLGLLVLAGILSMMLLVGLVLFLFRQSFGAILPVLLPVIYGVVIVLGGLMLLGRNPFARLRVVQTPVLSNPYITAYLYGLLLGPMTLPCTGPLITSAFVLGAGSATMLADGLLYFLFFGLGFGWPLIVLPWLALPVQRRFTHWLSKNHQLLARVSGLVLVFIGVYGLWTELIPNI